MTHINSDDEEQANAIIAKLKKPKVNIKGFPFGVIISKSRSGKSMVNYYYDTEGTFRYSDSEWMTNIPDTITDIKQLK